MRDFQQTLYQDGAWQQLPDFLASLGVTRWQVITDDHLAQLLDFTHCPSPPLVVEAGEASKCLATCQDLYSQLARLQIDRQTWLVAVGGGVVGDLVGLVAATYLRGLPLVQVPTSLVAQVDSSLGGKVGIDLPEGKNLVGSFYPPRAIFLDTELLSSLPDSQWSCGMAEVLKHGLLDGEPHWQSLEQLPARPTGAACRAMVLASRAVKRHIIEEDPWEQGVRVYLNLGHTLAHALESVQEYRGWNHGQAVALGLRAALRLSQKLLGMDPIWEGRLVTQLERQSLPTRAPAFEFEQLIPYLLRDKKNLGGQIRYVLLQQPGHPQLHHDVSLEDLKTIWRELQ